MGAGFRQVDELDDAFEVELLADPEVLVHECSLFNFIFELDKLLALRVSIALALDSALSLHHELAQLLGRDLIVTPRQCPLLKQRFDLLFEELEALALLDNDIGVEIADPAVQNLKY